MTEELELHLLEAIQTKRLCCAQAIVEAGLLLKGEENPGLVEAAAGLCVGLFSGHNCGALTGACVMLSLFDRRAAASRMIPDLVAWFEVEYGELYGGIDCRRIIGGDPRLRAERCPELTVETCRRAIELLDEAGIIPEAAI